MTSIFRRGTPPLPPALLGPDDLVPDAALSGDDIDRFDHEAIAKRVAELACAARAPVNIALFGPWGSGKSSVYRTLEQQIKLSDPEAAVVRYDAWKYGGQALKRNFISSLAKTLGLDSPGTSTELNEDLESTRLDLAGWLVRNASSIGLAVLLSLVVAALLLLSFAFATMHLEEIAYRQALSDNVGRVGNILAVALVGLLLGPKLFDSATTKVTRAAPQADDQFSEAFAKLVDKATHNRKHRLVVFIDELDRCAPQDVVATLVDLKTFLEEAGCVFVVAADRDVLEKALQGVPQSKPIREDEPYYSTPGAFLDKIFQHQMALPPLRPQALVGFARTTVANAGGLWAELRTVEGLFDDVVFTLVPAHVRSPRRVKVLLNSYATSMRVAQARGIAYLDRATEIAKLTVLQTEFPAVAGDLLHVPRLLALILEPPASPLGDPSDTAARAVRRYSVTPTRQPDDEVDGAAGEMLNDDMDDAAAFRAGRRLNEELLAYLKRTQAAGVPDPRPDLLYVQGAGATDGLSDPSLGEVIDFASENPPADTAARFVGRPSRDIEIAARLMALHSDAEFGPGKGFLVEAACRLAEQLDPSDLVPLAPVIAPSVAVVAGGRTASRGMLPGGLAIAAHAGNVALADRMTELLEAAPADEQGELLIRILPTVSGLGDQAAQRVDQLLAGRYLEDPEPLHQALAQLDAATALRVWYTAEQPIRDALSALQPPAAEPAPTGTAARVAATATAAEPAAVTAPGATPAERYDGLLASVDRRSVADPRLLSRVLLLGQSSDVDLYRIVRERAEHILPLLPDPADRRRHALLGITRGPVDDWPHWGSQYEPAGTAGSTAGQAATVLLAELGEGPLTTVRELPQILERVAPDVPAAAAESLVATVKTVLDAAGWDDSSQERRLLTYQACGHLSHVLEEPANTLFAADLDSALTSYQHDPAFIRQVRTAAAHMPPGAAQLLTDKLSARTSTGTDALGDLRVLVAAAVRCGASAPAPSMMAAAAGADEAATLSGEWLALAPAAAAAVMTFTELGWPSETAIGPYAQTLNIDDRTALWCAAVGADVSPRILAAVAESGVRAEAVALIRAKVTQGQRQEQRDEAVRCLLTAPLHLPELQAPACDLALQLLSGEISGDAVLAADIVVRSKGAAHGYTEKLRRALQAAEDRNAKIFRKSTKDELVALGILKQPKKKSLIDRVFG